MSSNVGSVTSTGHAAPDRAEHRAELREDYSQDRLTPERQRGGGPVLMVLIGIITAFFFPTTGGTYLLAYGAKATLIGLVIGFVIITGLTLIVTSAASREGLNSDLLTRGCGYGYAGSAITALFYAATFAIYAALEGQILASSIEQVWALPINFWYVVVGLVFIPLTWYGMTQLKWTMWITFPVYLVLLIISIVKGLHQAGGFPSDFFTASPAHSIGGTIGILGVLAGLAGTIGLNPLEFSDYARFIAPRRYWRSAWSSIVLPYALMFFIAFPLGIFFTLITHQTNPGIYFVGLLGLGWGVLFAWISQVRINLTNVYSGSIALSNFVTRTIGRRTSRILAVAIVAVASVILMMANVLEHLLQFLEFDGIILMAWVGTVVADLVIVKGLLHIGPKRIEYRRDRLRLINPVGVTALIAAVAVGSILHYGPNNQYIVALSAFIGFGVAVIVHTLMAILTKGRYYTPAGQLPDSHPDDAPLVS